MPAFSLRILALLPLALPAFTSAVAQEARPAAFRESVTLDTDGTAVKKLRSARRYLAESQWGEAIEILQQIATEHGRTLVSAAPGRYVNVADYCQLLLAGLPPEGLQVYRDRFDAQSRQWFDDWTANRSEESLRRIVERTFLSSYGDDALWRLGELAWARGDLSAAREHWERLLPSDPPAPGEPVAELRYPDSSFPPALVRARLVLCTLARGDRVQADRALAEFRQLHAEAEGELAGRTGRLVDILETVRAESLEWDSPPATGEVETFALNARRNKVLPEPVEFGAPLWSVPLSSAALRTFDRQPALNDAGPLSFFPVVSGETVLFNDAHGVYAFNLRTGQPAWPVELAAESPSDTETEPNVRAVIYPPVPEQRSPLPEKPSIGIPRYTLTVTEGRLYARVGSPVTRQTRHELRDLSHSVICLDLAGGQGRLLWQISALDLDSQGTPWAFEGSPVVSAGRAYIALTRSTPQLELAVACYDAEEGGLLWFRKVASALAQSDDQYNRINHRLLTVSGDSIYFSTDAGAVAAFAAADGTARWVATYESRPAGSPAEQSDPMRQGLLPCVYHQGLVIAAPNDSDRLLAFDAVTGVRVWERALPDRIRHLLGVAGGNLVAGGNSLWALDVETGRVVWRILNGEPEEFGYGRGLLAGAYVYWPTREELFVVHQQTGLVERRVRLDSPLLDATGGNLVIANGLLLIAQPDRLIAFGPFGGERRSPPSNRLAEGTRLEIPRSE